VAADGAAAGKAVECFNPNAAGCVAGIGPARARRLWQHFEDLLPEALDTGNVAALAAVMDPDRPVLGPRLAAALVAAWKAMASEARLVSAFPDPVSWRAMALPTSRLLDPSWLYTAVTRARQQVIKLLTNLPHLGRNLTDLHARVPGSRTGDVRTCSGSKDDAGWPESSR
jgi:hypothetical protein